MIEDYFESIQSLLSGTTFAKPPEVEYDRRDKEIGFLRGDLFFKDGSRLHFREFVRVQRGKPVERYMYVFQYMRPDGTMLFRYDDTEHFPNFRNAPHHKHIGESEVVSANAPDLETVLKEVEGMI